MRQMQIISESGSEPVTTTEAKLFLKVDFSDDDTLIEEMITQARKWVENYISKDVKAKVRKYYLSKSDGVFNLPFQPVASVDHVKINGSAANYSVLGLNNETIELNAGAAEKIEVQYTTSANSNQLIKGAILQLTNTFYDNRADFEVGAAVNEIPTNVKSILASEKNMFI